MSMRSRSSDPNRVRSRAVASFSCAAGLVLTALSTPLAWADGPTPDPRPQPPRPPVPMTPLFTCTSQGWGDDRLPGGPGTEHDPLPPRPTSYRQISVYAQPWSLPHDPRTDNGEPAERLDVSVLSEEYLPNGTGSGTWTTGELWNATSRFVVLFGSEGRSQLTGTWWMPPVPGGDDPRWPTPMPPPPPLRYAQASLLEAGVPFTQSFLCVEGN